MEILKGVGSFELLTPVEELQAQLLRVESAGRTCYQSKNSPITKETSDKFIRMLIKRGHDSVIEHTSISVRFVNISRGFTHEEVRHRLASYSQESTRYVDYTARGKGSDIERFQLYCVAPPHRDENEKVPLEDGRNMSLADMFGDVEKFYRALRRAGWPPEDARQVLPIGIKSEIVVTTNLREWRHIFKMRTDRYAHWEIRSVMVDLLRELKKWIPVAFEDFEEGGFTSNGIPYFVMK